MNVLQQIADALARPEVRVVLTIVGGFIAKNFPQVVGLGENFNRKLVPLVTGGINVIVLLFAALFPDTAPTTAHSGAILAAGFFSGFTIHDAIQILWPWLTGTGLHSTGKNLAQAAKGARS